MRGARPKHVLQVDILSITLGAPYGYNTLAPLVGIFPEAIDRRDRQIIPIDRETGVATLAPGLRLPTRPFFGIVGVAPPSGWGRVDTAPPRCHGGNMDNKELVAGTTLFLPVWAEGALLSVGDGHAAQGDGEVNITAIETSLEGECRLDVRSDFELTLPVAVTPSHLITMGFDPSLDQAARVAVRSLLDLLVRFGGMAWGDAYRLASIAADLHVTQVVNGKRDPRHAGAGDSGAVGEAVPALSARAGLAGDVAVTGRRLGWSRTRRFAGPSSDARRRAGRPPGRPRRRVAPLG